MQIGTSAESSHKKAKRRADPAEVKSLTDLMASKLAEAKLVMTPWGATSAPAARQAGNGVSACQTPGGSGGPCDGRQTSVPTGGGEGASVAPGAGGAGGSRDPPRPAAFALPDGRPVPRCPRCSKAAAHLHWNVVTVQYECEACCSGSRQQLRPTLAQQQAGIADRLPPLSSGPTAPPPALDAQVIIPVTSYNALDERDEADPPNHWLSALTVGVFGRPNDCFRAVFGHAQVSHMRAIDDELK